MLHMSFALKAWALLFLFSGSAFTAVCSPLENEKSSIVVFPCKTETGATATEGSFITERVALEILKQGTYKVIDRYEIKKMLDGGSGEFRDTCPDNACYFDLCGKCKADFALWGKIRRKESTIQLDLIVGDAAAKQIKNSVSSSITGSSLELAEQIPLLLAALLKGLPAVASSSTASAAPRPIALTVRSVPSGAKVFINGKEAGVTPLAKDSLAEGICSIVVDLYGYSKFWGQVALKPSDDKKILVHLHKIFGSLTVRSTPAMAKVVMSGMLKGTTPYTCDTLRPGAYTLQLSLDRYAPFTKSISITSGRSDTVSLPLVSFAYLDSLKQEKRKKNQLVRRIVFGTGTAAFFGSGLYLNMRANASLDDAKKAYDAYSKLNGTNTPGEFAAKYSAYEGCRKKSDDLLSQRNALYILGAVFLTGLSISIKF